MTTTFETRRTSALAPSPTALSELRLFTMPEGGIDRLNFVTWDTIEVLGVGEDTVELRGRYRIQRADPTAVDWTDASVEIAMLELDVSGVSEKFGPVHASVNYDIGKPSRGRVSPGTIYPGLPDSPKMCTMEGYMRFELSAVPIVVFNKEAIVLQHRITHIPPVGQGGGTREGVGVELFSTDNPDGPPVAILRQVRTHIGAWQD
ncbi:MAG TPA: DUF6073 family protein [Jatrophihabitans sp.]|nr:DUF6073 family protein [Jatrophihabitans sp.]